MRMSFTILCTGAALLFLVTNYSGRPVAADATGIPIAGTYSGSAAVPGFPPIRSLLTFHADGTFMGTHWDLDPGTGFDSPEHGAWRQTGAREIATSSLQSTYDPDGTVTSVFRIRSILTFDRYFSELSGSIEIEVFLPEQDPLRDDPVAVLPGELASERLEV